MNSSPSQEMLVMCKMMFTAACCFFFLTALTVNGVGAQTCGKSQNKMPPESAALLIHYGRNASLGYFPWQAALYTPLNDGKWTQICGGTLISPQLVLTAAHCFEIDWRALEPREVKVGLAKIEVDFGNFENQAMNIDVKQIVKHERYEGSRHWYGLEYLYEHNIALVVLSEPVQTNSYIMPACIDWNSTYVPQHNEIGYFAGYGATETGKSSKCLKWSFQKYISYNSCRSDLEPAFKKFITHDKFCCREESGRPLDRGDVGGGVTFLRDGRHYVYGLSSTRPLSDDTSIRFFTDLMNREHLHWLTQQWKILQQPNTVTRSTVQTAVNPSRT